MATTAGIAGRRAVVALLALTAALLGAGALLLGGGRGVEGHGHGTATSGVALPGGFLRVDSVTPEAPMRMHGMPMGTGPAMKNVPKGQRRFTIAVTVLAGDGKGLRVAADHFSVSADATAPRRPIDDDTDVVFVPAGASFPRRLTFDVPQGARRVELTVRGGEHPVALPIAKTPAHAHGGH